MKGHGRQVVFRDERGVGARGLGLVAMVTLAVVAWGYLVWTAIDFGRAARDGEPGAWSWLLLASAGAIACLFVGLLLASRAAETAGLITDPAAPDEPESAVDEPASVERATGAEEGAEAPAPPVETPEPAAEPTPYVGRRVARPSAPEVEVEVETEAEAEPASTYVGKRRATG